MPSAQEDSSFHSRNLWQKNVIYPVLWQESF